MISPAEVHSAYDIAYALAIPLYVLLGYSNPSPNPNPRPNPNPSPNPNPNPSPNQVLLGYSGFYAFGIFNSGANFLLNFRDSAPVRAFMIGPLPQTLTQTLTLTQNLTLTLTKTLSLSLTLTLTLALALTLTIFCIGSAVLGYLPLSYGSILLFLKVELALALT